MNADGTDQRQLTRWPKSRESAAWSPDGSKIAYFCRDEKEDSKYLMVWDGKSQTQIPKSHGLEDYLTWSPDGSRIASATYHWQGCEIGIAKLEGGWQEPAT